MIAQFAGERHDRWDDVLPELTLAFNSSRSESTGYSPAYLTYGREPRLPGSLFDETTKGSAINEETTEERMARIKETCELARKNMEKAAQDQARTYNLRKREWKPKKGDMVWVRQHPLSKANDKFSAKLAPKFEGPFRVIKLESPVIAVVKEIGSGKTQRAYVNNMKKYLGEQGMT
ncbi:hypothetical protein KR059_006570, partial [Drosophila kikkawai]